jgi:hypothetical protein
VGVEVGGRETLDGEKHWGGERDVHANLVSLFRKYLLEGLIVVVLILLK